MHAMQSKKEMVREMFDDISPKYDLLNHVLSFGIDRGWRRRLVRILDRYRPADVLDVATGTGDLAIAIAGPGQRNVTGIDISGKMLAIGRDKVEHLGLTNSIRFQLADGEKIPFADSSFDAVTVAFGVRNFEHLDAGISEMRRVLRPGGVMLILEFSHPGSFPMKQVYGFYSRFVIPAAGRLISGHGRAYTYLPESVAAFPSGKQFLELLENAGLRNMKQVRLTMGIASIYQAEK
jgi:demethylmenaquinone methyltransferase / 2-methoxy-6-polyprenyl-1,4-benzoquinol methylase